MEATNEVHQHLRLVCVAGHFISWPWMPLVRTENLEHLRAYGHTRAAI